MSFHLDKKLYIPTLYPANPYFARKVPAFFYIFIIYTTKKVKKQACIDENYICFFHRYPIKNWFFDDLCHNFEKYPTGECSIFEKIWNICAEKQINQDSGSSATLSSSMASSSAEVKLFNFSRSMKRAGSLDRILAS